MLSLRFVIWYLWVAIWNSEKGLLQLGFGFVIWWFVLSWCVATFGFDLCLLFSLCAIHILYLVFVNLWFCICERELFGCIWDLGLWECIHTNLYYPKFVIVKFVRHRSWIYVIAEPRKSWCFVSIFFWINFLHSYC